LIGTVSTYVFFAFIKTFLTPFRLKNSLLVVVVKLKLQFDQDIMIVIVAISS